MNLSKVEVVYNPNQDHQIYTPIILTASLLAKENSKLITIRSIDEKINSLGVDLLIDSNPLNQHLKAFSVCQLLIQLTTKSTNLYSPNDTIQIDSLVDLIEDNNLNDFIESLVAQLGNKKYLVSSNLTLADLFLWSKLAYLDDSQFDKLDRLKRWFKRVENDVKDATCLLTMYKLKNFSNSNKSTDGKLKDIKMGKKEEGKYVDLPGAEMGKVVVRFPPEASGYLHIGHAKAALLNQYYQLKFNGKLIFRFDDTNPEKEKEDFEDVIREDVALLKIKPDFCSYTSDYFDLYLEKCEYLIKEGKAFLDDTPAEQMKIERDQKIESKNRNNSVERNMQMWNEMKQGTEYGQKCCVRAKIDMKSDNGSLRDPTLYRCKVNTPHPRTGSKYKVYPTYDFACPIVDSIEGVTHCLRTTEYMDRDPQFYWVCDALGLRKPYIYAYSRLNLTHTVLSKRRLTWFVDNKIVSGWDDPRMPTVRGILRRGLTIDGLKDFIIKQGSSRSIVVMEWDKIWSLNRQVIDPKAIRFMGVEKENAVSVNIENVDLINEIEVDCHPKNLVLGKRKMKVSKQLLIDQIDAVLIKENEFVTFMNLGNVLINKIVKDSNGIVKEIQGKFDPANKDFKKTLKVTWLDSTNLIKAQCCYYENLIEKPILDKENDEFKDFVNKESEIKVDFLVEKGMSDLKKGDIIQILRKGFFICDEAYDNKAFSHTSLESKIILISIADGATDLNSYPKIVQDVKLRLREKIASFSKKEKSTFTNQKKSSPGDADFISLKIQEKGDLIRNLKAKCGNKDPEVKKEVDNLLKLKEDFKKLTGQDWKPSNSSTNQPTRQQQPKEKQPNKQPNKQQSNEISKKKQTKLGIETKKSENFSEWYTEVITKSEMIDYYDISGCYVLWEWSFGIWEKIVKYLDDKIKQEGVKNVGFPLFVSKRQLEVEKNHITDFAPEVAWVTKSGSSDLQEPIAIRPTSETVMYPYFAKRIQSHRDLPLKLNQWCNVVRWEFKDPTPFLRTREFYWQEGHTAHSTKEEAVKEVNVILDHYASVYEYLLAIPIIKGRKTEKEKFPGADMTTTIEGFISENGRGIQAATSHYLGQNFSKMFNIRFQNLSGDAEFAHQNSWGFTTRSIGVMVMEHSDDSGLVLPPRVAPIQVIIIPCGLTVKTAESEKEKLLVAAKKLETELISNQILAKMDATEHQTVGWKYGHYELKGVPIRIELGPKDLEKNEFLSVRRDTLIKKSMKLSTAVESIKSLLEEIQNNLFETAKKKRDRKLKQVKNMNEFNQHLNEKCLILAPFCGNENCEEEIKKETELIDQNGLKIQGAKSLCIPFDQPESELTKCVYTDCKLKPQYYTLFGRSY